VRAVVIEQGAVRVTTRPEPSPGPGQLLVRVEAAGLNGADLLQRAGRYPPPPGAPADIPGLECAGTVVKVGRGTRHREGDRVMGLVGGGGQAEFCLLEDAVALDVPDSLDWPEAGGFPEVFTTAHDALFTQCGLAAGERLLVTGAAGGVGLAAVQLAHRHGAEVVASVRHPDARQAVGDRGAEVVIDPAEEDENGPYDVVIELVGAASFPARLRSLATCGRIVFIGVAGSGPTSDLDAAQLMARRAVVRGSTLRSRSLDEKAATARALERDAMEWLASGAISVPVCSTFPLARAVSAYDRFAAGGKVGKIVLTPP
jgi:NADPH2:quinone reductase